MTNLAFRLLAWLHAFRLMLSHRKPRRRFIVITAEQLQALQDKVTALVEDNGNADSATAESHQRDTDAVTATAMAAQAKLDKVAADAVVAADVADVQAFVTARTMPPAG